MAGVDWVVQRMAEPPDQPVSVFRPQRRSVRDTVDMPDMADSADIHSTYAAAAMQIWAGVESPSIAIHPLPLQSVCIRTHKLSKAKSSVTPTHNRRQPSAAEMPPKPLRIPWHPGPQSVVASKTALIVYIV